MDKKLFERILELSGVPLLEADKRNIIVNKLGYPQKLADWAHEKNNKLSLLQLLKPRR